MNKKYYFCALSIMGTGLVSNSIKAIEKELQTAKRRYFNASTQLNMPYIDFSHLPVEAQKEKYEWYAQSYENLARIRAKRDACDKRDTKNIVSSHQRPPVLPSYNKALSTKTTDTNSAPTFHIEPDPTHEGDIVIVGQEEEHQSTKNTKFTPFQTLRSLIRFLTRSS